MRSISLYLSFVLTFLAVFPSCKQRSGNKADLAADGDEDDKTDVDRAQMARDQRQFTVIAQAYAQGFYELMYVGSRATYPSTNETVQIAAAIAGSNDQTDWRDVLNRFDDRLLNFYGAGTTDSGIDLSFRTVNSLAQYLAIDVDLAAFLLLQRQINLDDLDSRSQLNDLFFVEQFNRLCLYFENSQRIPIIRFYEQNIARMSVVELFSARQRSGIPNPPSSELQVYGEAWRYHVSFEQIWNVPFDSLKLAEIRVAVKRQFGKEISEGVDSRYLIATDLISQGVDADEVLLHAQTFDANSEALLFFLHYKRVIDKGIKWQDAEIASLRESYLLNESYHDITDRLRSEGYIYRTDASIAAKISELLNSEDPNLKLTRRLVNSRSLPDDIDDIPGFPGLRQNGHFDIEKLRQLFTKYSDRSNQEIADMLKCSRATINAWRQRLNFFQVARRAPRQIQRVSDRPLSNQTEKMQRKMANQRRAVKAWFDAYLAIDPATGKPAEECLNITELASRMG